MMFVDARRDVFSLGPMF